MKLKMQEELKKELELISNGKIKMILDLDGQQGRWKFYENDVSVLDVSGVIKKGIYPFRPFKSISDIEKFKEDYSLDEIQIKWHGNKNVVGMKKFIQIKF